MGYVRSPLGVGSWVTITGQGIAGRLTFVCLLFSGVGGGRASERAAVSTRGSTSSFLAELDGFRGCPDILAHAILHSGLVT